MPETMDGEYISDQQDQTEYYGYDSTHCEHGTFVGGWAGPDYMCHYCEMGVSLEDVQEMRKVAEQRRLRYEKIRTIFFARAAKYGALDKMTPTQVDSMARIGRLMVARDWWR